MQELMQTAVQGYSAACQSCIDKCQADTGMGGACQIGYCASACANAETIVPQPSLSASMAFADECQKYDSQKLCAAHPECYARTTGDDKGDVICTIRPAFTQCAGYNSQVCGLFKTSHGCDWNDTLNACADSAAVTTMAFTDECEQYDSQTSCAAHPECYARTTGDDQGDVVCTIRPTFTQCAGYNSQVCGLFPEYCKWSDELDACANKDVGVLRD